MTKSSKKNTIMPAADSNVDAKSKSKSKITSKVTPKTKTKTNAKSNPSLVEAKPTAKKGLSEKDSSQKTTKTTKTTKITKATQNDADSNFIQSDLNGCILIAMPDLENSIFSQSVVFVCDHAEHGSLGVVLNKPINLSLADLFDKLELPYKKKAKYLQQPILLGGPVESDKGFVIHPNQKTKFLSNIERDLTITTSMDILEHLAQKTGPEKFIIALGCAMWEAGQLIEEIRQNRWLVWHLGDQPDEKINKLEEFVFNTEVNKKYSAALKHLGLEIWQLTMFGGNA